MSPLPPHTVVEPLLAWSHDHLRDLPWRHTRDPWAILVSEVMLQQTQVARVIDRWTEFLERFPTPAACAAAPAAAVIEMWAGLGYNRRAVNLWRAAVETTERFDGDLPSGVDDLLSLPGIGPYTARAVAAFAYEAPVGVVDTNVGRLLARWTGSSLAPKQAQAMADALVPSDQSWRWNQTLFDFAVAVCTKRSPACDGCPLRRECVWAGDGPDPAEGSAGVSTGQSRFEGSRRQVRGRILDAVRVGSITLTAARELGRAEDDAESIRAIVASLERDGLVIVRGQRIELPT